MATTQGDRVSFELTKEHHQNVYGDQGILNLYFKDAWHQLPWTYNLQVGSGQGSVQIWGLDWYDVFKGVPAVIHYTLSHKPWTSKRFQPFQRDIWWFYYAPSWEDILLRKPSLKLSFSDMVGDFPTIRLFILIRQTSLNWNIYCRLFQM